MLGNVGIADAIKAELKSRGERTKATADEVLRELTRLAMFDPVDFTKVRSLADVAKLPEDARRAIVGWSWNKQGKFMIKLAKEGALEMLGRHHGVFKDGLPRGPLLLANVNLTPAERAQLVSQALADF
jgi:phage terminase small subunit